MATPSPLGLLAELTHRCPLACPYCSNPLTLDAVEYELDTTAWSRVFDEAAALGILHVHLSGGEPLARRDLATLSRAARSAGLYTNLITSGLGLTAAKAEALAAAGLDHVQISFQDSAPEQNDAVAGRSGAYSRKRAAAECVVRAGLPLTINIVVHRGNIGRIGEMVTLAMELGAGRVEIAHVQYYGWASKNRAALLPTRPQVEDALAEVAALRDRYRERIAIDSVPPDYFARYPKACMGGWGRRSINITPLGKALPCHAAESIDGMEFWSVREHSLRDIWLHSPAFNAFRGSDWMQEPCATCARRDIDFGGCRCQAFLLTGNARAPDPVCHLSRDHGMLAKLVDAASPQPFVFRSRRAIDRQAPLMMGIQT